MSQSSIKKSLAGPPTQDLSNATTVSVKGIRLMDQTTSKITNTHLLNYTPIQWFYTTDYYYTHAQDPNNPYFGRIWHTYMETNKAVSPDECMRYANPIGDIHFFIYVKGGRTFQPGNGKTYKQYEAIFFNYKQPLYQYDKKYAFLKPAYLDDIIVYYKVDYLNQHIVKAQNHSNSWRSTIRPQIMSIFDEIKKFTAEFKRRYPTLSKLAKQIDNGDNSALSAFKNELTILQNTTRQVSGNVKRKDPILRNYLEALANDIRLFTADQEKVSGQISGNEAEIKSLKETISDYEDQLSQNRKIDMIPFVGLVDVISRNSEHIEDQLFKERWKLETTERELHHQKAISTRLNSLLGSGRLKYASIMALVNAWSDLDANFRQLINSQVIPASDAGWIAYDLETALSNLNAIEQEINILQP